MRQALSGKLMLHLLLALTVLFLTAACESGDPSTDGDSDTDIADGDSDTDGDTSPDGDAPIDGDTTDGDTTDGDTPDGDMSDGDTIDGDLDNTDSDTESDSPLDGDLDMDAEPEAELPTEFSIWSSGVSEGELLSSYGCSPALPIPNQLPSPPLNWAVVPEGTKSFVLLMVDLAPDAQGWINWAVINLADTLLSLPHDASRKAMPFGAVELENSYGQVGYGGPCPSSGTHEYAIQLYAMSQLTVNLSTADKSATEVQDELAAMSPLGMAELRLTYSNQFPD
jgi:Raf kinase inhibitor-like YbhB/YbcL family protein